MSVSVAIIEDQFKAHEKFLWRVSYRLTGKAAETGSKYFFSYQKLKPYLNPSGLLGNFLR